MRVNPRGRQVFGQVVREEHHWRWIVWLDRWHACGRLVSELESGTAFCQGDAFDAAYHAVGSWRDPRRPHLTIALPSAAAGDDIADAVKALWESASQGKDMAWWRKLRESRRAL